MEKRLTSCKHRSVQAACSGTLRFVLAASLFTLVGCSQVPDELSPVEWYKGVDAWLGGDDATYAEAPPSVLEPTLERERVGVADEPFPNLSEVPERPPAYDPESAAEISESLVADRAHAQYSDELIRFQSEADTTLKMQARQRERKLAEAPPPQASPSAPVTLAGKLSSPTAIPEGVPKPIGSPEGIMRAMAPPPPVLTPEPRPVPAPVPLRQRRPVVTSPPPPPMISRPFSQPQMVAALLGIPASEIVLSLPYFPTAAPELNQTMQQYFAQSGARALPANFQQASTTMPTTESLPPLQAVPENGFRPVVGKPVPAPKEALITRSGKDVNAPRALAEYDPTGVGLSIRVATVRFGTGSSSLDKQDRASLKDVVGIFRQNGKSLRVIGHASSRTRDLDPMAHQLANFNVSVDRANRVAKELMRLGIRSNQIFVGAKSDSEPIYYEVMPSGEVGNRRAEIYIDY